MIEENAIVTLLYSNSNDGSTKPSLNTVKVESEIKSSCSGCKQVDNLVSVW